MPVPRTPPLVVCWDATHRTFPAVGPCTHLILAHSSQESVLPSSLSRIRPVIKRLPPVLPRPLLAAIPGATHPASLNESSPSPLLHSYSHARSHSHFLFLFLALCLSLSLSPSLSLHLSPSLSVPPSLPRLLSRRFCCIHSRNRCRAILTCIYNHMCTSSERAMPMHEQLLIRTIFCISVYLPSQLSGNHPYIRTCTHTYIHTYIHTARYTYLCMYVLEWQAMLHT